MSTTLPTPGAADRREPTTLTGHTVLDDQRQKVGTVKDVLYDDRGDPRWAVVDPGPMRPLKYVPIEGSYVTDTGDMVIPYGREKVKHAPKAGRDHVLDSHTEKELQDHYALR